MNMSHRIQRTSLTKHHSGVPTGQWRTERASADQAVARREFAVLPAVRAAGVAACPQAWSDRTMTLLPPRVLRTLHALNSAYPWDHNAHHHRWILRRLPKRFGRALDVGSGSGELARLLARQATAVVGLDADPAISAVARELTPAGVPVSFVVGRAPDDMPPGPHDVITCVAALHHLPFDEALTRFRERLAPGGTLVVVGLYRACSVSDRLLDAVAIPFNPVIGWIRNRGRRAPVTPAMTAPARPASMTYPEIVRAARRILPGARLRRRVFWRYTLVWRCR